ncbi:MAG TPA: peptidyl-prolyl cis-trans isomerase [Abditibacteriaceae bacterium]|jgi:foldase protein PrsA
MKKQVAGFLGASALALAIAGCGGPGATGGGGSVATVNGEAIGREDLHLYLEATSGERALREMIDNRLVLQEAKKGNIEVTEKDIDDVVAARKAEGGPAAQTIETVTKTGGTQLKAYRDSIKNQLVIDRLVTKDVKVDDKALQAWFTKNKKDYSTPTRVKLGLLITSSKPRADAMAQQLKAKTKTFAQLVDEQKKAKDAAAGSSAVETPTTTPQDELPGEVKPAVAKLKDGETTPVLLLTPATSPQKVYGILRLVSREQGKNPTLADVKTQVETDYKLEQIARKTVAQNPQNPKFDETVQRTQQYLFQQQAQQGIMTPPSRRDVLRFINQTAIQQLTTKLQTSAKVEIPDPAFAELAKAYVPAPTPGAPGATPAAGGPAAPSAPAAPAAPAAKQ